MSYISFENVKKVYQMGEVTINAVDGVDFVIEKGEFAVIVGPSGAGKTTVLNMLGGMDACSGGIITVDGKRVSDYNAKQLTGYRRHDIGFVFQFYNLVQNLTALENVELAAQICDHPLEAKSVLEHVGLGERQGIGEESEAAALRRADGRAGLCDGKSDPEASAGHLPAGRYDGGGDYPQHRDHADGGPGDPGEEWPRGFCGM